MNKITLGFFLAKSKMTIKGLLMLFAFLLMNTQVSWGQINIAAGGAAVTQDFNSLGASSTATLPTDWKAQKTTTARDLALTYSSAATAVAVAGGNSISSTAGNGIYRFNANNLTTESALGGLSSSSASKTVAFMSYFNNNAATSISSFTISYDVEKYRGGNNVAGFTIDLLYSTDGTTWTSCGSSFVTSFTADIDNNGYNPAPTSSTTVNATYTPSGSIAQNGKFYFAWRYSVTTGTTTSNAQALGFDNVSITANGGASAPDINIKGNAVSIVDGATPASTTNDTDFGTVATSTDVIKTYAIENTGSVDLVLTAPFVRKSMATTVFTITQPTLTTIPAGSSTTFSVTFNSAAAGSFDEGIEVLSDDTDEGVYDFAIKAIAQTPTPNIVVKGNNTIIATGDITPSTADHTDFSTTVINGSVVKTYTIENTGTGTLTINNILMNTGTGYTISGISFPATVLAASSTTFTVTFNSSVAGTFADTVLIDSNDPTDSTYDFAVTAKAVVLNFGVGDISIIGMTTDTPDSFTFVNWVPIPVDAELIFTDNAYEAGALKTNENSLVWKNNTGNNISIGTVILINDTPSTDLGTIVSGNLNGLSTSGENLFIYEGSAASPNFIYGLSNLPWITTGTITTSNSHLPTVLNVTNGNIVTGNLDNVEYSGVLAPKDEKSSFSAYKGLVNDPANWAKNDNYFALNSLDFEIAAVWETAAWTDGLTPTASLKTVIKDTYTTTTNGVFTAKKLTVNAGKSLTINSGTSLTVQNEVINNGSLVVENNANLIQVNGIANTGAITVNRNSNALKRLDYTMWSSPVTGAQTLAGFSPLTSQSPISRFYIYDNTLGTTGLYSSVSPATSFTTGTGYLIRMPNEDPSNLGTLSNYYLGTSSLTYNGVFTGTPNNGDVTLNVVSGTYNAVGNPYPSSISAALFMSGNGITSNSDALYFWRKSNNSLTSSYATYTTAGGTANSGDPLAIEPNGTIQVGQGFIAKSTSATLKFTNSMRTANNSNQILKTKQIERNRIWLNLSNETTPINQMMVAYMTGASQGFDSAIDGSYINDSQTALNSLISNEEYVIQGRSLPFDGTDVVPLAFKTTTAGNFTIAIDHVDGLFASAQKVYLVDSKTGTETDLKASAYTFAAVVGVDNTRFSLKYQRTLGVNGASFDDNTVVVYKNKGTLYVNSGSLVMANIKVFDIQGRLIAEQKNVKANTATIKDLKATQQVLIVKITSEDNTVVNKKVVN